MKFEFKVSGDSYEDRQDINIYVHAHDLYCATVDALDLIRTRLKHEEPSEEEEEFLEKIREALYLPGIHD